MNEAELKELLVRLVPSIDWSKVGAEHSLKESGLDSLDKANVIMELETRLSTKIDDEQYEKLDSVKDILNFADQIAVSD